MKRHNDCGIRNGWQVKGRAGLLSSSLKALRLQQKYNYGAASSRVPDDAIRSQGIFYYVHLGDFLNDKDIQFKYSGYCIVFYAY